MLASPPRSQGSTQCAGTVEEHGAASAKPRRVEDSQMEAPRFAVCRHSIPLTSPAWSW
jgi:hypothetical protein